MATPLSVPTHADLLIVGAGPAGCAAAITARRLGLSVVVIERDAAPRDRPGETLHPGVEPLLRQLGVWESVQAADFPRHHGIHVGWDGPPRFQAYGRDEAGEWLGLHAWRSTFDVILQGATRKAGAVILQPCQAVAPLVDGRGRVTGVQTMAGAIRATVTIDAAGHNAWLRRGLGLAVDLHSHPLLARYGYVHGTDGIAIEVGLGHVPVLSADPEGWTWLSRVRGNTVGWVRVDVPTLRREVTWCPPSLSGYGQTVAHRASDVTWRTVRSASGDGYMLAGDAAGVVDPVCSHGVLRALMSGIAAAHAAYATAGRLPRPHSPAGYDQWLGRWFREDIESLRSFYGRLWSEAKP